MHALSQDLRLTVQHVRLPFQLLLAPIFLLGAFLGGPFRWSLIVPFLAVHVGIYGGITAWNGYYDQDRGPIGLLKHPQPPTVFVRDAAIVLQIAGLILLALVRPVAALAGGLLVLMGIAYSHPRWRWKRSLAGSLLAVGIGQGCLAFLIGWTVSGAPLTATLDSTTILAAISAMLIVVGLYPLTQIYQIEEDRERGDRTLAVVHGWRVALVFSGVVLALGVGVVILAIGSWIHPLWPPVLLGGVTGLWLALAAWARLFESQEPDQNHDWALGLSGLASAVFWALLVIEWTRNVGA